MTRGLKYTFFVHMWVSLAFGLLFLLSPELYARIAGYSPIDPLITRAMGVAVMGLAFSSWLGFRATTWEEIRILLEAEVFYTVLMTATLTMVLIFTAAPAFALVPLALHLLFAIAFIYFLVTAPHGASASSGPTLGMPSPRS